MGKYLFAMLLPSFAAVESTYGLWSGDGIVAELRCAWPNMAGRPSGGVISAWPEAPSPTVL